MAVLIHGNAPTLNPRARRASALLYNVQDWADERKLAIEAGGGQVAQPARVVQIRNWLIQHGLAGRFRTLIVPGCGWKLTAPMLEGGRVETLFAIDGMNCEGVAQGVGGAKPLASLNASGVPIFTTEIDGVRVGGYVRTPQQIALADNAQDWASVFMVGKATPSRTLILAHGNDPVANSGFVSASLSRNQPMSLYSYTGQNSDYLPAGPSSTAARMAKNVSNGPYGATSCVMMMMQISTGRVRLIVDGDLLDEQVSATGALFDYAGLTNFLQAGAMFNGSANMQVNIGGEWSVFGCLPSGTPMEHVRLAREARKWGVPL